MFADILPHCLSSLLFSQSPTLVMVTESIWPMGASWRSTWPKMRRSWSSSHLVLIEAVFSGRRAKWGQKQDGHGEKLGVALCVTTDAFPHACCSVIYRATRGRVSGTGSDRRWYIDKVSKAIYEPLHVIILQETPAHGAARDSSSLYSVYVALYVFVRWPMRMRGRTLRQTSGIKSSPLFLWLSQVSESRL